MGWREPEDLERKRRGEIREYRDSSVYPFPCLVLIGSFLGNSC